MSHCLFYSLCSEFSKHTGKPCCTEIRVTFCLSNELCDFSSLKPEAFYCLCCQNPSSWWTKIRPSPRLLFIQTIYQVKGQIWATNGLSLQAHGFPRKYRITKGRNEHWRWQGTLPAGWDTGPNRPSAQPVSLLTFRAYGGWGCQLLTQHVPVLSVVAEHCHIHWVESFCPIKPNVFGNLLAYFLIFFLNNLLYICYMF